MPFHVMFVDLLSVFQLEIPPSKCPGSRAFSHVTPALFGSRRTAVVVWVFSSSRNAICTTSAVISKS